MIHYAIKIYIILELFFRFCYKIKFENKTISLKKICMQQTWKQKKILFEKIKPL